MRREVRSLAKRSCDSLVLSVELFNRPNDRGRTDGVLILMDRSLELLLKAAIVHRGGEIWQRSAKETIGFDKAIRVALSNGQAKFLDQSDATTLRHLHAQRNAAQHHLSDISEGLLYMTVTSSLSVFRSIFENVLNRRLADELPERVLPLSTSPPRDIQALFDNDIAEVQELLKPGRRQRGLAEAKLAPWAVLEGVLSSETDIPLVTRESLRSLATSFVSDRGVLAAFPLLSAETFPIEHSPIGIEFRFTKGGGIPIHLATDEEKQRAVIATKEVTELDRYPYGKKGLHRKLKAFFPDLTEPKAYAAVRYANLDDDREYSKVIELDQSIFRRYSPKVVDVVRRLIDETGIEQIWEWERERREAAKKQT